MRSWEQALKQYEGCSYEKGKFGREDGCTQEEDVVKTHRERDLHVKMGIVEMHLQGEGYQTCQQTPRDQESGAEPQTEPALLTPWSRTSSLQTAREYISVTWSRPVSLVPR